MSAAISSSSSDPPAKDRKKSAHWTDADTDILITLLLRYKDSGRTADNGFKPEVWREASGMLEGTTFMGGPKTPEACKSRWQRLQRDFKAAKEMEALPGVSWDRKNHRLSASQDAWDAAEKQQTDAYKYQKIHLPSYDSLSILCVPDDTRGRIRGKPRTSMASVSDSSSMLSLSVSSGHGQGQVTGMGNEGGPSHMSHGHMEMPQMMEQDTGMLRWEGDEDEGGGQFEASFTMPDGSQHPFTMPHAQKRLPFDTSLLAGPSTQPIPMSQRPSPTKRLRPTNPPPHRSQPLTQQAHPASTHMTYHIPLPPSGPSRSPDFSTSSSSLLDTSLLPSPHTSLGMHVAPPPQPQLPSFKSYIPPSIPTSSLSAEVYAAGLSEAQRRTEALLQLQTQDSDLRDEDLLEIMAEFEANVAAADTYLAIKRDGLRRMWLTKLVRRRKR